MWLGMATTIYYRSLLGSRLAKFNIDKEQSRDFIGLPTPASALLCALGQLLAGGSYMEYIAAIAVVVALLLISPRRCSLKFVDSHGGNALRYTLIILSLPLLVVLQLNAFVASYRLYSAIDTTPHTLQGAEQSSPLQNIASKGLYAEKI